MRILFSILRYQLITNESINLGILFHNLDTDDRRMELIKNWKRVTSFDDELDVKYLKLLLNGMKEEIQNTLLNSNIDFDIEQYTKYFMNELRFSDVFKDKTDDYEYFIEATKKNILRYDYEKLQRPNKTQHIKYIKSLMKNENINFNIKSMVGEHCEDVNYDYIIGQYAFKLFTFESKNLGNLVHSAKAWAYTAEEMKSKYKTIFIYDVDIKDHKFNVIIDILSSSSHKVLKLDEAIEFIFKIKSNNKFNLMLSK